MANASSANAFPPHLCIPGNFSHFIFLAGGFSFTNILVYAVIHSLLPFLSFLLSLSPQFPNSRWDVELFKGFIDFDGGR